MQVLTSGQRSRFKNVFGKPLDWERLTYTNSAFDDTMALLALENGSYESGLKPRNGLVTQEMLETYDTPDEFEREGIEIVGYFLYLILGSPFFYQEMELSGDQVAELAQLRTDWRGELLITSKFQDERLKELIAGKATYPDEVKKILLGHQIDWLPTCELQLLTASFRSSFGLLHPAVIEGFSIDKDQQRELQGMAKKYQQAFEKMTLSLQADLSRASHAVYRESYAILTAKQAKHYSLITGIPIN